MPDRNPVAALREEVWELAALLKMTVESDQQSHRTPAERTQTRRAVLARLTLVMQRIERDLEGD